MGNGLIIFGLLGLGSVVAGKSSDVYKFVGNIFADSRFIPTMLVIIALFVLSSFTESKGAKVLIRSLAFLFGIAVLFSRSVQSKP
jgi:hypothetical protein